MLSEGKDPSAARRSKSKNIDQRGAAEFLEARTKRVCTQKA